MRSIGFTMLLLLISVGLLQAEESTREAPAVVLETVKKNCADYAAEDGIAQEEMEDYLLECINNELADLDYGPVDAI